MFFRDAFNFDWKLSKSCRSLQDPIIKTSILNMSFIQDFILHILLNPEFEIRLRRNWHSQLLFLGWHHQLRFLMIKIRCPSVFCLEIMQYFSLRLENLTFLDSFFNFFRCVLLLMFENSSLEAKPSLLFTNMVVLIFSFLDSLSQSIKTYTSALL